MDQIKVNRCEGEGQGSCKKLEVKLTATGIVTDMIEDDEKRM